MFKKSLLILLLLGIYAPAYGQNFLKNLINKTVDQITNAVDESTVMDSAWFATSRGQHFFDITAAMLHRGYDTADYASLNAAETAAEANDAILIIAQPETLTTDQTIDVPLFIMPSGHIYMTNAADSIYYNEPIFTSEYHHWMRGAGTHYFNKTSINEISLYWAGDLSLKHESAAMRRALKSINFDYVSIRVPAGSWEQDTTFFFESLENLTVLGYKGKSEFYRADTIEFFDQDHMSIDQPAIWVFDDVDSILVKDLVFDAREKLHSTVASVIASSTNSMGALVFRNLTAAGSDIHIIGNEFRNYTGDHNIVSAQFYERFYVEDNVFHAKNNGDNEPNLLEMDTIVNSRIHRNVFNNGKYGVAIYQDDSTYSANVTITSNEFYLRPKLNSGGSGGIQLTCGDGSFLDNTRILDNKFQSYPSTNNASPFTGFNSWAIIYNSGSNDGEPHGGYLRNTSIAHNTSDSLHQFLQMTKATINKLLSVHDNLITHTISRQTDEGAINIIGAAEDPTLLNDHTKIYFGFNTILDSNTNGFYIDSTRHVEFYMNRIDSTWMSGFFFASGADHIRMIRNTVRNPGMFINNNPDSLTSGVWFSNGVDTVDIDGLEVYEDNNAIGSGSPTPNHLYSAVSIGSFNPLASSFEHIWVPAVRGGGTKVEIRDGEQPFLVSEFPLFYKNDYSYFNAASAFMGQQAVGFDVSSMPASTTVLWWSTAKDTLFIGAPGSNTRYILTVDLGAEH